MSTTQENDWIKIDLHIHTLDDPKDAVDFSAHQLLERARSLGFRVLAITLHDAVFDRKEVFADAADMGILLISAAEVRLLGADVIVLNVTADEVGQLRTFDDLRQLRARRRSPDPHRRCGLAPAHPRARRCRRRRNAQCRCA